MIFSSRNCNYPQPKYCKWWLTQFRRWGWSPGAPDYDGVAKQVMRPDIYEEAMKEIGYAHGGPNNEPETLFDGKTFDPTGDLEAYAQSFAVHSIKARAERIARASNSVLRRTVLIRDWLDVPSRWSSLGQVDAWRCSRLWAIHQR